MRNTIQQVLRTTMLLAFLAVPVMAGPWDVTVGVGGNLIDETGDRSTVQETYNLYDKVSLSRFRVAGNPWDNNYLMLDLREINLDSRQGSFLFRQPGQWRVTGRLDQHRQVFDPSRAVTSDRQDWHVGLQYTPTRWLSLSGDYNFLRRDGDRLSFPAGTQSVLGTRYDNKIQNGRVAAELRQDGRGMAVDYRISTYTDHLNGLVDRTGQVVSARFWAPGYFYDKATHMLRGAWGKSELDTSGLDYTLARFEYTGLVRPIKVFQFKYNFDIQRIDNQSTALTTDRIQNDFTATWFHRMGSAYASFGYETNDDDQALTSYKSWIVGGTVRDDMYFAQLRYTGRDKDVTRPGDYRERTTLLEDVEASRVLGRLDVKPNQNLSIGGHFNVRAREFPVVEVKAEGESYGGTASYDYPAWGRASGTYTYTDDDYTDRAGGFAVRSHIVTGRLDVERVQNLHLAGGVTFFKAERDMDIEKSILFFEGRYTLREDLHFDVKYNVYNYDDFILQDRYYTANVVWFNVAYDLHVE